MKVIDELAVYKDFDASKHTSSDLMDALRYMWTASTYSKNGLEKAITLAKEKVEE